jgi:hypothetical protein
MPKSTPFEVVSAQFEAMGLSTINLQSQPAYSQVRTKDKRGPLNHGQVYCQIRGVLVGDVAADGNGRTPRKLINNNMGSNNGGIKIIYGSLGTV